MIVGKEWIIDASGCRPDDLSNLDRLRAVFQRVISELNLQVACEPIWRQFPAPGGVTGMVLLTESHLTCHTYPEFSVATFNLYCCRDRPEWPWAERLGEMLGATAVRVRVVERREEQLEAAILDFEAHAETRS